MYLTQGVHRAVQSNPEGIATIFGSRTRTHREIHDRVASLAGGLRELGVEHSDRVAILALNSDRYHECLLAVPWADAILVPVNVRWSLPEIAYALADSGAGVLFVDARFAPLIPDLLTLCMHIKAVIFADEGVVPAGCVDYEQLILGSAPVQDARREGESLAGLFYTGGTTGRPKGVMLSHSNLLTSTLGLLAAGGAFGRGTRYLHAAPMFHIADLVGWVATELLGGTHIFLRAFSATEALQMIESHQVSETLIVPTMVQALVSSPDIDRYNTTSLRTLLYGASPMPLPVLEAAFAAFPGAGFVQLYGMTETSPIISILGPEEHQQPSLRRSAGRAAPHTELLIVDSSGNPQPTGQVGEIIARGSNVMRGYWKKSEQSVQALMDDWMHTGDGGYLDRDGYLFVVDRLKDMIITGGENVYSAEVENAVLSHPDIAACAVIGVPDERWGEAVHAVVVLKAGSVLASNGSAGPEEIIRHTRNLIAGYKTPRTVSFIDQLPLSGAGKVLKTTLRANYRPETDGPAK